MRRGIRERVGRKPCARRCIPIDTWPSCGRPRERMEDSSASPLQGEQMLMGHCQAGHEGAGIDECSCVRWEEEIG